jgi:hypothetical protein
MTESENLVANAGHKPSTAYRAIEDEIRELPRAIDLASVALISDQDEKTNVLQTAFEYLEDRAAALRKAVGQAGA